MINIKTGYKVGFVLVLVLMLLLASIMPITQVKAENILVQQVASEEIALENKCQQLTKNEFPWDNADLKHFEKYIPKEYFLNEGMYGYIGKKYGFVVKTTYNIVETYKYNVSIVLLNVNSNVDKSTTMINYTIEPKKKYAISLKEKPTGNDSIEVFETHNDELLISDLFFLLEINTINEISETNAKYDITNDNSVYIDCVFSDYNMQQQDDKHSAQVLANFASSAMGTVVDSFCGGVPISLLMSIFADSPEKQVLNQGVKYNAFSYSEQINKGQLETKCAFNMGKNYLGIGNKITLQVKYDNKLHTNEDFQLGIKVGFNVYDNVGGNQLNEEMFESYTVFANEEKEFALLANSFEKKDNKIVETFKSNKFITDGQMLNLNFTAPENGVYDFLTTDGTVLSQNSINAQQGQTYQFAYNLANKKYGEIVVKKHNNLNLGNNEIYAGYSVLDINCKKTEALKYTISSTNGVDNIYITDENGNILNENANKDNITYLFKENQNYRLFIKSSAKQNVVVEKSVSEGVKHSIALSEKEKYYFGYVAPLTNYINLSGNGVDYDIYNDKCEVLTDNLLYKDKTYYFAITNADIKAQDIKLEYHFDRAILNSKYPLVDSYNQIMKFDSKYSAVYQFNYKYDVYCDGNLTEDVNSMYMEKGKTYYIINNFGASEFLISYKIENISTNIEQKIEAYTIYKFNLSEYNVYTTDEYGNLNLYNKNGELQQYKHGFLLNAGEYYLIANKQISVNLVVTKQPFKIIMKDQNKIVGEQEVYYGYDYSLLIRESEHYSFNGWTHNGELITNEKGISLLPYSIYDNIECVASWTIKKLYIQIVDGDNIKWVTSEKDLTNQKQDALIFSSTLLSEIINEVQELQYTDAIKKEGYFKKMIRAEDIVSSDECIVVINIEWHLEQYKIIFTGPSDAGNVSVPTSYNQILDINSKELNKLLSYRNSENYDFYGWEAVLNDGTTVKAFLNEDKYVVADLTKNEENRNEQNIIFYLKREPKTVKVKINIYELANNMGVAPQNAVHSYIIYRDCKIDQKYRFDEILKNRDGDIENIGLEYFNLSTANASGVTLCKDNANLKLSNLVVASINNPEINVFLNGMLLKLESSATPYGNDEIPKSYDTALRKIKLVNVYKAGYKHVGWSIAGKEYGCADEVVIPKNDIAQTLYLNPRFEKNLITVNSDFEKSYNDKELSKDYPRYRAYTFDLTNASNDVIIQLNGDFDWVEFIGNGSQIENIYIEINSAYTDSRKLTVCFERCNFLGRKYSPTPTLSGTKDNLTIVVNLTSANVDTITISGSVVFEQQDFTENVGNSLGAALMTTSSLELNEKTANSKLTLYGGNGKDVTTNKAGKDGIDGGSAWIAGIGTSSNMTIKIYTNVVLHSGDGTNGHDGANGAVNQNGQNGGRGGRIGYGFITTGKLYIDSSFTMIAYAGKPGNGGNGGKGGNGQDAELFGQSSKPGGNGGNGGDGGVVVSAIIANSIEGRRGNWVIYSSVGGKGGAGGTGGKPLIGDRRPNGSKGSDGINYNAADVLKAVNG